MLDKEVRVFVNTRPYKLFTVRRDQNYIEVPAAESLGEDLNKPISIKKFTAGIEYNEDGYYADIFSNELSYKDGNLVFSPAKGLDKWS